jgi:hypothetical protein
MLVDAGIDTASAAGVVEEEEVCAIEAFGRVSFVSVECEREGAIRLVEADIMVPSAKRELWIGFLLRTSWRSKAACAFSRRKLPMIATSIMLPVPPWISVGMKF